MSRLRKFLHLSLADQLFLLRVAVLLVAVRLGLSLLPFPTLRRWIGRSAHLRGSLPVDDTALRKVTTAVEITSRPAQDRITCLTKALATHMLLLRLGYPAELRIGVARGVNGRLESHAWVEWNGQVVMGAQQNMQRYTVMPSWDGRGA